MNPEQAAKHIRRSVIHLAHISKGPHVGSALSCVDILACIYFHAMRLDPWEKRDIFILSKAHAATALYSTLAERGILDRSLLDGYYQNGGTLPAHLDRSTGKGIEVSAGSLGHGFNMGLGMAYGFKKRGEDRRVFVVLGDGETQEGSIWEGALFAPKFGLDNVTAVIDFNNLQGYGHPTDICSFEPIRAKWESFGWQVLEADGHDHGALCQALDAPSDRPRVIIANTTKGKGVSFMENELVWHYFIVTDEYKARALEELA